MKTYLVWGLQGQAVEMDSTRVGELYIYFDTVNRGKADIRRWMETAQHGDILRVGNLRVMAADRDRLNNAVYESPAERRVELELDVAEGDSPVAIPEEVIGRLTALLQRQYKVKMKYWQGGSSPALVLKELKS